jgi:hypothetical protein
MREFERFRCAQGPIFVKSPFGRPRTDARRTAVVRVPKVYEYDMDASTDQGGRICHGLATLCIPWWCTLGVSEAFLFNDTKY